MYLVIILSHNYSMRVDEGTKCGILLAIKMNVCTRYRVAGRGEEGPRCDAGSLS